MNADITEVTMTKKENELIEMFAPNKVSMLQQFVNDVLTENHNHNLIGKNTIKDIWTRHVIDSLQLVKFVNNCDTIFDLGSGAGFPIIPLAIATNKKIVLVEKSPVKSSFLKKVCKKFKLDFIIINEFITADKIAEICTKNKLKNICITSRAFKSVCEILALVDNAKNISKIVLLKGRTIQQEIDKTDKKLLKKYTIQQSSSITGDGVIVEFTRQ